MLIVGAGGLVKDLWGNKLLPQEEVLLYDDQNEIRSIELSNYFEIATSVESVTKKFGDNFSFVVALGSSYHRRVLTDKMEQFGGELISLGHLPESISKLDEGALIFDHTTISSFASIGKGLLMYSYALVSHDCSIGDFVTLSPGATLLGEVIVGHDVEVGANATILPRIKIGSGAIIGAGAVVISDVPENATVVGNPARIVTHG